MTAALARAKHKAVDLRSLASRETNAKVARRLAALTWLMERFSRTDAARAAGFDEQTTRERVHRYNASDVPGLSKRPHMGPEARLTPEEKAQPAAWVRQDLRPKKDGVMRWRLSDQPSYFGSAPCGPGRAQRRQDAEGNALQPCFGATATHQGRRRSTAGAKKLRNPRGQRRPTGHHAATTLDWAGWNKLGGRLVVPANTSLLHLPPYSPQLNPVENV